MIHALQVNYRSAKCNADEKYKKLFYKFLEDKSINVKQFKELYEFIYERQEFSQMYACLHEQRKLQKPRTGWFSFLFDFFDPLPPKLPEPDDIGRHMYEKLINWVARKLPKKLERQELLVEHLEKGDYTLEEDVRKIDEEIEILKEIKERLEGEFVENDMEFLTMAVAEELKNFDPESDEVPPMESS